MLRTMDRYLIKGNSINDTNQSEHGQSNSSSPQGVEVNLDTLHIDPGKRKSIYSFDSNNREKVRRFYLQKGPCQPKIEFPKRMCGNSERKFIKGWFEEYCSWLEYSISEDSAYCLCCYLFKPMHGSQSGGDTFVSEGFTNYKQAHKKFREHMGAHNSVHRKCVKAVQDLLNQKQHIETCISSRTEQDRKDYRSRLIATIDVIRFCLSQGLAFRGHDETKESTNKGNFLSLLEFLANHNEEIKKVVLENAPGNSKLTSPDIQKDIINAMAIETTKIILDDLGDDLFSILVDESRDISIKEQMVMLLRYVDKKGCIVERFLGVVHVSDTTSPSLKVGVEELLSKHGLSLTNVRGQCYDGASNMQGEFNGLKSLILKDNPCAFYVHCFAHQLQLALISVMHKDKQASIFFTYVSHIVNVVAGSCKRQDLLRDKQANEVIEGICGGEILTGRGLNQEATLKRPGDTRWGTHYSTLLSLIRLFGPVIDVLEEIEEHTKDKDIRGNAGMMLTNMQNFDFIFFLHFMANVLGLSNELSHALQRKDQDIVNAMKLVKGTKSLLSKMRNDGWESLINEVTMFCEKHDIMVVDMSKPFVNPRRKKRKAEILTNLHHYRFDTFNTIIDIQLQCLNDRFGEISTELLLGMGCLDPQNSFCAFDSEKLINFAKLYPFEFSPVQLMELKWSLLTYFEDVSTDDGFLELDGIAQLGRKMVETGKYLIHPLVFKLLKLALLLPVATAGVERAFSTMSIVKNRLRNRIGDDWLNDLLVTYIERDVFLRVKNDDIMKRFQNMKSRRNIL